ncbi:M15 family metallopeptidase [Marivirga sp.]|uniref:M15 family metallopeptidase n=1 Tax=Marivirga sp. TaxID=2018662 RepID=UPI0025D2561B|nr:M15 family metallopeptidase [Marivirga sp.]
MRQFNREFKRSEENFDKDAYYLFVIDGDYSDKAGLMPFKRQFGYIFKNNVDNINKTIAHELAHGAFRLRHTFSDEAYIASEKSTDNLMDYRPDGTELYKHQWDLVHDPESMIGWLEDDEEGEMGTGGAIDFLSLKSNSKLSLKPEPIKLKYLIDNWDDEIKKIAEIVDGLSFELSDYHLMVFLTKKEVEEEEGVSFREVVFTEKFKEISNPDGEVEWLGQIDEDGNILNSSVEDDYVLNLGVLHNSHLDKNFISGRFYVDERDENGLYRIIDIEMNKYASFIDLLPDIEFEVNKAGENWEEVDEEVKSIVDNFKTYESFESVIRDQSHGIGEIFENIENPLQYMYDQTEEVEFLKTTLRVHSAFKEKLESIEEELGDALINVYSSSSINHPPKYKDNIGGINLRRIQESTKISNHSYGLCVDIYPKGNIYLMNFIYKNYKGDMEVIAFINQVTGLNIMSMNDARLIVEKNQMFVDLLNEYDLNDFQNATEIFEDYEKDIDNYSIYKLENENPFSSFDEFIISLETQNSSAVQTYYERVKKFNEFLNSNKPLLEFFTFSETGREQLVQLKELSQQLYSDISLLENNFSNENISSLLTWVADNTYELGEISVIIDDLESFKSSVNSLGYSNFEDYSDILISWNNNRFNNNLFQDGFCDVPITLINTFLNQQDISWGGTWNSGRVDYMHFEIPEALVSDYLTE